MEIMKTKDYGTFRSFKGNRSVSKAHVERLVKSITRKNFLAHKPILVNSRMEIIDGQHRLEAAKALGVEVYFVVAKDAEPQDAALLNANANPWVLKDYMNMQDERENEHYRKLKEFMQRHSLETQIALMLVKGKYKDSVSNEGFKAGSFVFEADEHVLDDIVYKIKSAIQYIKSKGHRKLGYLNQKRVWWAMYRFINEEAIEWDRFMRKLELKCHIIKPMPSCEDFLVLFKEIYNYKASAVNRI